MTKYMNTTSLIVHAAGLFVLAASALFLALVIPDQLFAQTSTSTATTTSSTSSPVMTTTASPSPSPAATPPPTPAPTTVITNTSTTALPIQMTQTRMLVRDLALGSTGSDVTLLQQFLASNPGVYPESVVTGYFGRLTEGAVKRFQAMSGISAVGRVGPQTRALVNAQMSGQVLGAGVVVPQTQTGDRSTPLISSELAATTRDTATLSWTTSEPARGYVFYGTEWPYVMMHNMTPLPGQLATLHQTTITGLIPGERYYYKIAVVDASGNVTISTVPQTFDTAQ